MSDPVEAPSTTEPTSIAIAVVRRAGCYLIGQRAAGQALAGKAEFPGGKIEPGESPGQAVVRECLEETGLAVRVIEVLDETTHHYDHGAVRLVFYLCEPIADQTGENLAAPCAPFRWVGAAELAELKFPEANRAVLARLTAGP